MAKDVFRLHALQAAFGDCLLLEFGTDAAPLFMLIDGGPPGTYDGSLRDELKNRKIKQLELVVLSHIDNDHVVGLLDFFADLQQEHAAGHAPFVKVPQLWHNAFSQTIDPGGDVQVRLKTMMATAANAMSNSGLALNGIQEGSRLHSLAAQLSINVNNGFANKLVLAGNHGPISLGNVHFTVVGPTKETLDALKKEWQDWLDEHEGLVGLEPLLAANSDASIPNLSSIMIYAECKGKTMLLTGDGRSDHLLEGLAKANILKQGACHVNLLKLPHHGSDRNMTKTFFKKVTADTYVISADGKNGNPDLATLIWLVEAAHEQQREAQIVVTNNTPSTKKLLSEYPASEYGYKLSTLKKGSTSISVVLL